MKVTLEREGVFITIKSTENEGEDILENYKFNDLTAIASETLSKIFKKLKNSKQLLHRQTNCSEIEAVKQNKAIIDLKQKLNHEDENKDEKYEEEYEEEEEHEEEEEEEDDEEEEYEYEEEEEEEYEEEEEDEYEEDEEEEDDEEEQENSDEINISNICFETIQLKDTIKFTNIINTYNFKTIMIKKTNKEERIWVLKLIANMHNIHAWSQNKNGRRELIIQKISS